RPAPRRQPQGAGLRGRWPCDPLAQDLDPEVAAAPGHQAPGEGAAILQPGPPVAGHLAPVAVAEKPPVAGVGQTVVGETVAGETVAGQGAWAWWSIEGRIVEQRRRGWSAGGHQV